MVGAIGCRGLRLRGGRTVCAVLAPGESERLWQLLSSTNPASFSCRASVPLLPHIQMLQVAFSLLLCGFSAYTSERTDSLVVLSLYGEAAQPRDLFLAFSLGGTSLHYKETVLL